MSEFIVTIPPRLSQESEIKEFLMRMDSLGGSDVFFLGGDYVWMSINGRKVKMTTRILSDAEILIIAQTIHDVSAQASLFSGNRIDIPYEFRYKDSETGKSLRARYRVNMVSCQRNGKNSITITVRGIPTTPPKVKDLGVENIIVETCDKTDQGLILVVGATGSGKSTLLASILRDQLEDTESHRNIVTVESPIEFVYDDIQKPSSLITQLQVGKNIHSFEEGVINCMRMAPNTILVGEMRDYETVSAAIEASVTGHAVIGTAHSNNVSETFQRLVATYPKDLQQQARFEILQSMKMVVAQRLVPTIDGKRTAIREYLILNQKVKDEILESQNMATTSFLAVEKFGRPMMSDVNDKYESGIISEKTFERLKSNYDQLKDQMMRFS